MAVAVVVSNDDCTELADVAVGTCHCDVANDVGDRVTMCQMQHNVWLHIAKGIPDMMLQLTHCVAASRIVNHVMLTGLTLLL